MKQEAPVVSDLGPLGPFATGGIVPDGEGEGSLSQTIRDTLDSAYVPTTATVVASCIDGRGIAGGATSGSVDDAASSAAGGAAQPPLGPTDASGRRPDAAGGTLALWVAFVLNGCDLPLEDFLKGLQRAGVPIGGHTDDHAHGEASGCGANDKLGRILELVGTGPALDRIVALVEDMGVPVSEAGILRISKRADALSVSGSVLLGTPVQRLSLIGEHGSSVTLGGGHTEQLIVINAVPGTTLDRQALKGRLGEQAAAFNVDVWAFAGSLGQAAAALGLEGLPPQGLLVAMLLYNLATALVLCGPSMRLLLRSPQEDG
ncbi:MAG: hypothetical protein LBL86_09030 [Coriobacteriales bacterium]|jgi:hypothetical protein|nr:hypothetical protein [Coriobacteriales bacterium]